MARDQPLLFEIRDGIAWFTLNRPESLNATNRELGVAIAEKWHEFAVNPAARVAIVSGAGGRAFSVGADLKERAASGDPHRTAWAERPKLASPMRDLNQRKPSIAAISGHCLAGGLELALACDIRIATPDSQFGLPEIRRGFYPGAGGPSRLARTIPLSNAMEMLLTGDPVGAEEALRLGIISRIVPSDALLEVAEDLARRIMRNAPLAVEAVREVAYRSLDMPLDQAFRLDQLYRSLISQTDDAKEGPRAFVEQRDPAYHGQ